MTADDAGSVAAEGSLISLNIPHPEGKFTLASEMDDVSIEDVTEEFSLETWREYRRDSLERIRAARPDPERG